MKMCHPHIHSQTEKQSDRKIPSDCFGMGKKI